MRFGILLVPKLLTEPNMSPIYRVSISPLQTLIPHLHFSVAAGSHSLLVFPAGPVASGHIVEGYFAFQLACQPAEYHSLLLHAWLTVAVPQDFDSVRLSPVCLSVLDLHLGTAHDMKLRVY